MDTGHSYCEACGASLQPLAQFCDSCGQQVGVPPPPLPPPSPLQACIKCGQSDKTYTAAAFARQDFSAIEENVDEGEPSNTQELLARPDKPALPYLGLWVVIPFIPIVNAIMIWFAPLHKSYKFVLLGLAAIFVGCVATPRLYEMGAYPFVGIAMLIVYYGGLFVDRGRQKADLEQQRIPEWNRMVAQWDQVRYCRRCDLAWLANDPSRQVPPQNLKLILTG